MDDDNDQQLIKSQIQVNQDQALERRRIGYNIAALTNQDILFQKDHKLFIKQLPFLERKYSIDCFLTAKDNYERGIARFKASNNVDEIVSIGRQRKRAYSIDNLSTGAYYLYNWISNDEYPCQKPAAQQKVAHVVYEILAMRWHKALNTLRSMPKTLQTTTLEFVLKGFQTIQTLISQESQYYQDHFINRSAFPISFKNSSLDSIGGSFAFINIFEEQSKNKFKDIKAVPRKVECLKMNLDYLANFSSKYRVKNGDDYLVLAFKLLGNTLDQNELHSDSQKQFGKILADLNLKIYDRVNYATKLLPQRKRKFFCNQLEGSLPTFPSLDNILYYLPANNKIKQGKIERICTQYLDQYGDLQTVAYLSLDYPFLRKYYRQYKQLLQFSHQNKELEKLQTFREWTAKEEKVELDTLKTIKMTSFFDCVNLAQQKINTNDVRVNKQSLCRCEICDKKVQKTEGYLFCGKCRHGGHPLHLLKWFEESQSCPHIGCSCTCN